MKETYKDFIGIYDDAVSVEFCDEVIDFFLSIDPEDRMVSEEIYGGASNRRDASINLEEYPQKRYAESISDIIMSYVELYKKKYYAYDHVKHFDYTSVFFKVQQTEPQGGYHLWHCEVDSINNVARSLVWMIYLNDVPEGEGETEFLWQGLRVQPKAGTLLIWPAQFTHTHRGNPVYNCTKYISTGWIEYSDLHDGNSSFYNPDPDDRDTWMRKSCESDEDDIQSNKEKPYKRFVDLN